MNSLPLCEWTKAQKAQNNEFVENGLKNWGLADQTDIRGDSDDQRIKWENKFVKKESSSVKSEDVCSYISFSSLVTSLTPECPCPALFSFSPPFILFLSLIPTFHVHARWLVLILVLSTPPISLHVVAVRLKYTIQISPPH